MMKGKKVLSMLLSMVMLMTSFVLPVSADSANVTENVTSAAALESNELKAAIPDASEADSTKIDTSSNLSATPPATAIAHVEPAAAWNKTIVEIDHGHTVTEVVEMIQDYPHSGFDYYKTTSYDETPNFYAPYSAGSLAQEDIDDAENAAKVVRFLAGLPYEDVTFSDELNNIAQHGAVLLAASNQFSHGPSQPVDMSDEFFSLGYQGCSEANISAGRSNISNSVLGFMYDGGSNNIARAGHRRWILSPGNQEFGIGYADGPDASYGGYRINMHVFAGLGYWECESDSYIAWPSDGAFPIQYMAADEYINTTIDCPWSINLGSPYAEPSKDSVVLKLTRTRDGKTWTFDKNTPNLGEGDYYDDTKLHLSVDNGGYGITKAIVFRPDLSSLGSILDGDVFKVELSGITYTDGSPATLSYEINFFDLKKATNSEEVVSIEVQGTEVPYSGSPQAAKITLNPMVAHTVTYNGSTELPLNAGDYDIIVTVTEEGYTGQCAAKMTIIPAEIEVTADAKSKKLGTEDPELTYTITSGQLYGDDALTGELIRTTGEDAGTYEIQQGTLQANSNYNLTFKPASFTITDESGTLPLPWQNPFIDVHESDWYYSSVEYAYKNNLFSGLTATQFGPNVPVTRGMLVTVLYRAEGKPEVSAGSQFADVAAGAYYEKAVTWAEQNGIVSGYSDTVFAPDAPVLREQIASIFYRYARYKGLSVNDIDSAVLTFKDANDISSYAVKSIQYCISKNIMYGRTTDIFKPLDHATRAEMAAILQRFLVKIQSGEL